MTITTYEFPSRYEDRKTVKVRASSFQWAFVEFQNNNAADIKHGRYYFDADFRTMGLHYSYFGGNLLRRCNFTDTNLSNANFREAKLSLTNVFEGAIIDNAIFDGVDMQPEVLKGARLNGLRVLDVPRRAQRQDGYEFFLFRMEKNKYLVRAGCRTFTMDEAWAHWEERRRNTSLGDESHDILTMFELYIQRRQKMGNLMEARGYRY